MITGDALVVIMEDVRANVTDIKADLREARGDMKDGFQAINEKVDDGFTRFDAKLSEHGARIAVLEATRAAVHRASGPPPAPVVSRHAKRFAWAAGLGTLIGLVVDFIRGVTTAKPH